MTNILEGTPLEEPLALAVSAARRLVSMVGVQRRAFMRHQERALARAARLHSESRTCLDRLASSLKPSSDDDSPARGCLAETAPSLREIGEALAGVTSGIHRKVHTHTLFSDLARNEMDEMLRLTERQLRDMCDMLATFNPTLRSHVLNWCRNLSALMSQFTSQHEERLIQGICSQPGAAIFVGLTDNLRDVCYHVRSIADACPVKSAEL